MTVSCPLIKDINLLYIRMTGPHFLSAWKANFVFVEGELGDRGLGFGTTIQTMYPFRKIEYYTIDAFF